jgi:hypothetical protein
MNMARRVLLLGRLGVVVEDAQQQLRMPDVQLLVATGLDEVRSAFAQADIDHVIMGAGLDRRPGSRSFGRSFSPATRRPST